MSLLKDFLELKENQKNILISLIVISMFTYTSICFLSPSFIKDTLIHIPILFSFCFSIVLFIINCFVGNKIDKTFLCKSENMIDFQLIILFSTILSILQILPCALIIYFFDCSLISFVVLTTILAFVVLYCVVIKPIWIFKNQKVTDIKQKHSDTDKY